MKKRWMAYVCIFTLLLGAFLCLGADTPEQKYRSTKIWSFEPAGRHIFFVSNKDIAITDISFETSKPVTESKMVIEASKSPPFTLLPVSGAYQYFVIGKFGIGGEEISGIKANFRVPKTIDGNSTNLSSVKLHAYGSSWALVPTKYVSNDSSFYYYAAEPEKIDYLAISFESVSVQKNQATAQISSSLDSTGQSSDDGDKGQSTTQEESQNMPLSLPAKLKSSLSFPGTIAGIIIFVIILSAIFAFLFKGASFENIEDVHAFVEEELAEGVPKKEIEKTLVDEGWPKSAVDKIVHSEHLPHEVEIKIMAYVQNMKSKGASAFEIKQSLVKEGWSEELIDYLLETK